MQAEDGVQTSGWFRGTETLAGHLVVVGILLGIAINSRPSGASPELGAMPTDQPLHATLFLNPTKQEDFSPSCKYSLTIPGPGNKVAAIWVMFDRERLIEDFAQDREVLSFTKAAHIAILLQGTCPGLLTSDNGDMNMEPKAGIGPALFEALGLLSSSTSHPELRRAPLIVQGFSGTGILAARIAAEYPGRIAAAILAAPGHFPPQTIDHVILSARARSIPELIIVGGEDSVAGTELPYRYFLRNRRQGAPWVFALANDQQHHFPTSAKRLILSWLTGVLSNRRSRHTDGKQQAARRNGWNTVISTTLGRTRDSYGKGVSKTLSVRIRPRATPTDSNDTTMGWVATNEAALEWLAFERLAQSHSED